LRRNTLLFLGYNLADPDFRFLFDQIAESRFARVAYAVWPGLSEVDRHMWRDRGIVIMDVDPFGLLDQLTGAPQQPATPAAGPPLSQGMDLDRGIQALRRCLANADAQTRAGLETLVGRLADNQRQERLFGGSETTRNERAQIIFSLNELALKGCGVSFNELCQGAAPRTPAPPQPPTQPPIQPEPPLQPARRERAWIPFKLQVARLAGRGFEVRAFETPMGEPHADSQLPYDLAELDAILKLLEFGEYSSDRFTSTESEALQSLGLLRANRLVPDLLPRIGRALYQALFPGQVGVAFQTALNQAQVGRAAVALQVRFDPETVDLARYPWELLHDGGRHLLSGGIVELARYISYSQPTAALPVAPPWRLLYVAARPRDLAALPDDAEALAVWNALDSLAETGKLSLDRLDPPTYDALLERMAAADLHILHFDGHGVFARRCPECASLNQPHLTTCGSCAAPLDDVTPLGYLAFEDESGNADYVSTEAMENLLLGGEVRLMLLSACQSAVVQGQSLFGGLGPGLIRAGVPAVLAMQLSMPVEAAVSFARGFYTALAQAEAVPRGVAQGRRRLFRDQTWFIPTLYLRSTDDEGKLFVE
jgi:hypothetical protein